MAREDAAVARSAPPALKGTIGFEEVDEDGYDGDGDGDGGGLIVGKNAAGATSVGGGTARRASANTKQLRRVAFPPLPRLEGGGSDEEKEEEIEVVTECPSVESTKPQSKTPAKTENPPAPKKSSPPTSASSPPPEGNGEVTDAPEQPKSYKEALFERTIAASVVNIRDLRKLAWNGIPVEHRAASWKILLGYLPANASRRVATLERKRAEYGDAIAQHYDIPDDARTNSEQETLRQVLVDVPRTAPEVPLFHNDRIRRCLSRLLYIWAMRHPASSYVQGINDLATPFVAVFLSDYFGGLECLSGEVMGEVTDEMIMEVEADTYWCLTNLLSGIQDHYTSDQPGMQRMVMRLEELVNRIDADLAEHLRNTGIEFLQFAFKWMNCLLLREFRLRCVMRLWDTYLSEGDGGFEDFHVYVCASFLVHFSGELQQMGFDELFGFMQNMPTDDWTDREIEVLLSSAFVLSTLFGGSDAHLNVVRQQR